MQKGTASLLLIIVIILIVGVVGIFIFNKTKTSAPQFLPKISIPTATPKFSIYSNSNLGFEFQYQNKDLKVLEDSEESFNKRGNGDFRKNFKGYVGYEPGQVLGATAVLDENGQFDTNPFSVWVFNNDNNLTIEQWFQNYWYYPFVWGVFDYTSKGHIALDTEATISGKPAKFKIVSYQPGKPKFVYVSNNGKIYLFRIIGETGDQILSAFKFTN